jgi:hypothetical protein
VIKHPIRWSAVTRVGPLACSSSAGVVTALGVDFGGHGLVSVHRRFPNDGSPPDTAQILPVRLRRLSLRRSDDGTIRQSSQIRWFGNSAFVRPQTRQRLRRFARGFSPDPTASSRYGGIIKIDLDSGKVALTPITGVTHQINCDTGAVILYETCRNRRVYDK